MVTDSTSGWLPRMVVRTNCGVFFYKVGICIDIDTGEKIGAILGYLLNSIVETDHLKSSIFQVGN